MSAIVNNQTLHYANTNIFYPSKNETTQKLQGCHPKPYHARFTYHGGIVSEYTKTFQEYINLSSKQQNLFPERGTTRKSI